MDEVVRLTLCGSGRRRLNEVTEQLAEPLRLIPDLPQPVPNT